MKEQPTKKGVLPVGILYLNECGVVAKYDPTLQSIQPKYLLKTNFLDFLAKHAKLPFDYAEFLKSGVAQTVYLSDGTRITFLRVNDSLSIVLCSPPTHDKNRTMRELDRHEPKFYIEDEMLRITMY